MYIIVQIWLSTHYYSLLRERGREGERERGREGERERGREGERERGREGIIIGQFCCAFGGNPRHTYANKEHK